MKKGLTILGIIALVIGSILVLTAAMPTITTITVDTGNATELANYPLTANAIKSAPIWMYFFPPVIGFAAIIFTLKRPTY